MSSGNFSGEFVMGLRRLPSGASSVTSKRVLLPALLEGFYLRSIHSRRRFVYIRWYNEMCIKILPDGRNSKRTRSKPRPYAVKAVQVFVRTSTGSRLDENQQAKIPLPSRRASQ